MLPPDAESAPQVPVWAAPTETPADPAEARPPASYRYLLDIDQDLADEFDLRMRIVVRRVVSVLVFEAPVGRCDVTHWFPADDLGPGLLVLDGLIAVDVRVGERTATELVGAGDLLQPWEDDVDQLVQPRPAWRALLPTRIAVLDAAFAERVRPWPQIMQTLLRRAGRRARNLDVQRAISSQPRLEVRLALLFWHLAARWGRVERGGIHLSLPLTHALIGRLAGAERPSVSHALGRLADAGLVTGAGGDWHLNGSIEDHLGALQRPVTRLPHRARVTGSSARAASQRA
jgi:CRP/FNR family transcriptional regulator, cyclic AMP receptor protein